jgi:hypothetical protein
MEFNSFRVCDGDLNDDILIESLPTCKSSPEAIPVAAAASEEVIPKNTKTRPPKTLQSLAII